MANSTIKPLVFYDVPRVPAEGGDPNDKTFSPNTWKTRYVLNMKGIPYKTEWIEYPDIAGKWKELGIEHGAVYAGISMYTTPTIYDPNTDRYVTDSEKIAFYLDEQYPQGPALFPPHTRALQVTFMRSFVKVQEIAFPMFVFAVYEIMTPYGKPYIRATREQLFGRKLEEVAPTGEAREESLKAIERILDDAAKAIKANGGDTLFFGGDKPVYADVFIAATLSPYRTILPEDHDLVRLVKTASGGHWARLCQYFEQYGTVQ